MVEIVYWADIQAEMSAAGLNIVVEPPVTNAWHGTIDEKSFVLSIPVKSADGHRDWMVISLFGQDETAVIPKLSQMMGYNPFCKYLTQTLDGAVTYEWGKDAPDRIIAIESDSKYYQVERLEDGFKPIASLNAKDFYQQFTPAALALWEDAVKKNPDAEIMGNKITDLLPFMRLTMPQIGKNQSMFGLSIISIKGACDQIEKVVRFGLEPLMKANLISQTEADQIVDWFNKTEPTWDSGGVKIIKELHIGNKDYRLITDSYRDCRDLNLQII